MKEKIIPAPKIHGELSRCAISRTPGRMFNEWVQASTVERRWLSLKLFQH